MIKNCQITKAQQDVNNIVYRGRIIWRDISTWISTYLMVKTLQGDTELLEKIKEKLLRIVEDFGGLMRTFFGDKAAADYINLFSEYIMHITSLIDALVEGNSNAADEIVKQIYESAGKRIELLTEINPYWDKNTLENYIYTFTDMTIKEIIAFTSKQYESSINIYERILSYSTGLGDFLAQGIKNYLMYNLEPPTNVGSPPTVE
ncbi:hypothetical protein [Aminipila terrae]|uniref:Uncharacterized protein n=1 Tax=Aminipila terrae TaxID=2697030 RepID=A0A6P1MF26_9FIRM|nr:hypothetical protein [Aminipila terrae]QHI73280.1 hypothetical protein Ami3637_13635 [Aminipila terrae]